MFDKSAKGSIEFFGEYFSGGDPSFVKTFKKFGGGMAPKVFLEETEKLVNSSDEFRCENVIEAGKIVPDVSESSDDLSRERFKIMLNSVK